MKILGLPLVVRLANWVGNWRMGGGCCCCFIVKVRKSKVLLWFSRELSRLSEISWVPLYAADSSILASSLLGTHEMGSYLVFIKIFLDVLPKVPES